MQNVSGFGFGATVQASNTFPSGFDITQFADDTDPFDTPDIKIADKKVGLNGDLIVWSTATAIEVAIGVIPGSDDDINLAILLEANRVGAGKQGAQDVITLTGVYPQGPNLVLGPGAITDGPVGSSIASAGRMKSKVYKFTFEQRSGSPA